MNKPFTTSHWLIIMAALFATIGGLAFWHFHGDHGHDHHGDASVQLTLNQGQKWPTDEPLRTGMGEIRDLVTQATTNGVNHLNADQAGQLSQGVQEQVSFLINNCKLEPEADAALHVLIGEMLQGAEMLKDSSSMSQGLAILIHALDQYPLYFDHENWLAPESASPTD